MRITKATSLLLAVCIAICNAAFADSFGSGELQFTIDFVHVGSPGNSNLIGERGNDTGLGGVDYEYRIAKFETPEKAISIANELGGLGIAHRLTRGPDKPISAVTWFEAARFVNWLNQDRGYPDAYKFSSDGEFSLWESSDPGYQSDNVYRNANAFYFLPSLDEWYKAAVYDPENAVYYRYATEGNSRPVAVASGTQPGTAIFLQDQPANVQLAGGESPFGTVGQQGNIAEYVETSFVDFEVMPDTQRYLFASAYSVPVSMLRFPATTSPASRSAIEGFRVASRAVPEPAACWLAIVSMLSMTLAGRGRS